MQENNSPNYVNLCLTKSFDQLSWNIIMILVHVTYFFDMEINLHLQ